MVGKQLDEQQIFHTARKISSPEARAAYVTQICGDDVAMAQHIAALLKAHDDCNSFLECPVTGIATILAVNGVSGENAGSQIGRYKLLEKIGEGGMGMVFLAEQTQPVHRKVALKVIKEGMDTSEIIARFEAERQALAMMDHINIARVLDAGATDAGRPYFVMELVHGVPITKYCDENRLTPRERLELFAPVCHAIQHAHQKGIIHRDVKPSNVMVTLYDGKPVPKVIDFGVAKAMEQKLTERTLFTRYGTMVGTLEYMSPEQAEMSALGVDTRSDIFSLGVLLYELLTGSTPLTRQQIRNAAYGEVLRLIKEQEPPRPSTRLSNSGEALASISAMRKTDPAKLAKQMRGELDWIVMKTLEKDRNRRYETASGLAADIQRYLNNEPVQACPPSSIYRFRKFARRNRGAVLAAVLVLSTLLVGIAGTTIGLLQARTERDKALAAQEKERLALVEAEENFQTAREAVDKMYTRAAEEMRDAPQLEQIRRALLEDAVRFYQRFLKRKNQDSAVQFEMALAHRRVGEIYGFLGKWNESLENHRHSAAMLTALSELPRLTKVADYHHELAQANFHTGYALLALLRLKDGAISMQRAITLWEPMITDFPEAPAYLEGLARANLLLGRAYSSNFDHRGSLFAGRGEELLKRLKQRFPDHQINSGFKYDTKNSMGWRFLALPHDTDTLKNLEQDCREQLAVVEAVAQEHPDAPHLQGDVADWQGRLARLLQAMDRLEEMEQVGRKAMEIRSRIATQHPQIPEYQRALAWEHQAYGMQLYEINRQDEAIVQFRTAIAIVSDIVNKNPENLRAYSNLMSMLRSCPAAQLRDPQRVLEMTYHLSQQASVGLEDLGMSQTDAGQYSEALATCEKAKQAGERSPLFSYMTAVAFWHLGKQDEARELVRQIMLQLFSLPNQYWYAPETRWRARELMKLMRLDFEELKTYDLEKALRSTVAHSRKLAADRPDDAGLQLELAQRCTELAHLLSKSGKKDAIDAWRDAAAAWEITAKSNDTDRRWHLAGAYEQWFGQLRLAKKIVEAETVLLKSLDVWEKLAAETDVADHRWHVAIASEALADLRRNDNRAEQAADLYLKAGGLWDRLVREDPNSADYRSHRYWNRSALGETYNQIAWSLVASANPELQAVNRAVELSRKAVELVPDSPNILNTLGVAYFRASEWKAAIEALLKSEELSRGRSFSHNGFFVAMAQWQRGEKDQAHKGYVAALVWMEKFATQDEELRRFRTEAATLLGLSETLSEELEQAKSDLQKYVAIMVMARPADRSVRRLQAQAYAANRQWQKAAEEYVGILEHIPGDLEIWCDYASVLLLQDNHDGYQQVCQQVLNNFGTSQSPHEKYLLARILALDPSKVTDTDAHLNLAERATQAVPDAAWVSHTLATALCRAGRFDAAAEECQRSMALKPGWGGQIVNWLLLAIVHQRAGNVTEAREWMDKAEKWIQDVTQDKLKGDDVDLPVPSWSDRLEIQLLLREAKALMEGG